jgi:hypothetical protein
MLTLEDDRSLLPISRNIFRPREEVDRIERIERDSSLSLDLDVGLGTSKPPGLEIMSSCAGDLLFLRFHGVHEGDSPRDEGVFEDIMRSDISCVEKVDFFRGEVTES